MRKTTIMLMAIGFLSLYSCEQKTMATAMLENSETRTELFDAIGSNHMYMTEFLADMEGNEHAMKMVKGNKKMGTMMKGNDMQMMMKDTLMSMTMMDSMMKDGKMMNHMMQMMHKEGMMSEDCMKSGMQMMMDKGMPMEGMDK